LTRDERECEEEEKRLKGTVLPQHVEGRVEGFSSLIPFLLQGV
jgi:hypothetical protein